MPRAWTASRLEALRAAADQDHQATCARKAGSPRWPSTGYPGPTRFFELVRVPGTEEPHGWRRPRRRLPRSRPRRRLPPRRRRRLARSPLARRPRSSLPRGRGASRRPPRANQASRLRHGPQRDRPASPRANRPIFFAPDRRRAGSWWPNRPGELPRSRGLPNSPRLARRPTKGATRPPRCRSLADWSSSNREVCGTYRGAGPAGLVGAGPSRGRLRGFRRSTVGSCRSTRRGCDQDVISCTAIARRLALAMPAGVALSAGPPGARWPG